MLCMKNSFPWNWIRCEIAKFIVQVCTFRLVVKNAASLLDKNDPVKLEAEASLDDLIRLHILEV